MTSNHGRATEQAELARLLDAWGGEPSRWPQPVRRRMAELAAHAPETRALLAETRALDHLLDRAREAPAALVSAQRSALVDRIVAAAIAEQAPTALSATVPAATPAPARDNVVALPNRARIVRPATAPLPGSRWHAAGLMAASLLVGIYLGGTLNIAPMLQDLAEAVGLSTGIDATLGDDLGEEDAP